MQAENREGAIQYIRDVLARKEEVESSDDEEEAPPTKIFEVEFEGSCFLSPLSSLAFLPLSFPLLL